MLLITYSSEYLVTASSALALNKRCLPLKPQQHQIVRVTLRWTTQSPRRRPSVLYLRQSKYLLSRLLAQGWQSSILMALRSFSTIGRLAIYVTPQACLLTALSQSTATLLRQLVLITRETAPLTMMMTRLGKLPIRAPRFA